MARVKARARTRMEWGGTPPDPPLGTLYARAPAQNLHAMTCPTIEHLLPTPLVD